MEGSIQIRIKQVLSDLARMFAIERSDYVVSVWIEQPDLPHSERRVLRIKIEPQIVVLDAVQRMLW
jgi:hypothetical protein